jgi:phospholipase/carboxylesterase
MAESRKIGALQCTVVDHGEGEAGPDVTVILCHGYGAPGTDLVPLAEALIPFLPAGLSVRFLFPQAPIVLEAFGDYEGRAWWELSINSLLSAIENGQMDVLRSVRPEGLDEARDALASTCEAFLTESGLSWGQTVLGGFSQGAMLATDYALRLERRPAHLALLSGTLLNEQEWRPLAGQGTSMQVLQSHGQLDPVLPFPTAIWLRDLLSEQGHDVEFIEFPGPHTIPGEAITALALRIARLAEGHSG